MYGLLSGLFLLAVGGVGVWFTVTKTDYIPKLIVYIVKLALPIIMQALMKRKDPELEAAVRQAIREGQDWDNFNNRVKEKH
jgi:hypothetical protein